MLSFKLKGGALYIALFLSLIIALVLSMIILMSYYYTIDYDSFLIEDKVKTNATSALNYGIVSEEEFLGPKTIDLYNNGDDSVTIKSRWWGCYKSIAVKASKKNKSLTYNCLIGSSLPADTCLICPGKGKPVSVAGRTLFSGLCFLPKSGVKTAYVDGQNFIGDKPVDGIIKESVTLPELDKAFLERTENLLYHYTPEADSLLTMDQYLDKDSIKNSFINKTLYLHSDGILILSNKVIEGNVLIHSAKKIIVESSCTINQALLVAPKIEIKERFSGSLQAFATDTIITENEVTLHFPSSLAVYNKENDPTSKKQPALSIGEKNFIKGQLIVYNNSNTIDKSSYLRISKESVVKGSVYCNGYTDLQAAIEGLLITNSFLLVTPSSVYENHVLDATIDRKALSDYFSAGMIFGDKRKKNIAKWLN